MTTPELPSLPEGVEAERGVVAAPLDRATIWLTPPPPPPPPAPPVPAVRPPVGEPPSRPAHRPMTPRARRRLVKLGVRAVAAIFVFTLLSKLVGQLSSVGDSKPDPSSVPSPTACPAEVARWLPGSGDDAVLVAQYRTDRHLVTLCRDRTGQLHYDGQVSGAEVNSENHISLDAVQTANGFTARNKTYLYEINGLELTLKNNGKLISQWRLTRVRP